MVGEFCGFISCSIDCSISPLINAKEANVKGPHLMVHYFIKHFCSVGTIITMTSAASGVVHPGMSSYAAAKLALNRLGECIQLGK